MAVVHKGKKSLNGQARQYFMMSLLCIGLLIVFASMLLQSGEDMEIPMFFMVLPILWIFGAFFYYRKYKIFKAGSDGEISLLDYIRKLPNQYHVFMNLSMKEKRIYDEVDFVVVGTQGVFVIEVKHHVGKIIGKEDDIEWNQLRVDQKGKQKRKSFANPIKRTKWHAIHIERILHLAGLHVGVQRLLVFTNPKVRLDIDAGKMTVLKCCEEVNSYILNYKPQRKLDKKQVQQIVDVLEMQMKKS